MTRRQIHGLVLNAALAAGSLFYLFSPGIFAYVTEIDMRYSRVPDWFAETPPARLTARFFDRYNANAPRAARYRRRLSCYLFDAGATRVPGCRHEVRPGELAYGPERLKIASGMYLASFEFAATPACSSGQAHLQVVAAGRFGNVLADYNGEIAAGQRVELPFRLRLMPAAFAAVEFRIVGVSGCVLLERASWKETGLPAGMTSAMAPHG